MKDGAFTVPISKPSCLPPLQGEQNNPPGHASGGLFCWMIQQVAHADSYIFSKSCYSGNRKSAIFGFVFTNSLWENSGNIWSASITMFRDILSKDRHQDGIDVLSIFVNLSIKTELARNKER
jgi:hypothetical protein